MLAAPADDRRVEADGLDHLARVPLAGVQVLVARLGGDGAAEADVIGDLGPLELPRAAVDEPVLGQLDLPAVVDELAEQAVLVADAETEGWHAQRRHALHEAGGEPAEAAVAERRIGLEAAQLLEVDAEARERVRHRLDLAEIADRIEQQPADEELEREVVDPLLLLPIGLARGIHPPLDDAIAHGERGGDEPVVLFRVLRVLADLVEELRDDARAPRLLVDDGGRLRHRRAHPLARTVLDVLRRFLLHPDTLQAFNEDARPAFRASAVAARAGSAAAAGPLCTRITQLLHRIVDW